MTNTMMNDKIKGLEGIKINEAKREEERQAIFRFRYKVHIEELNRQIPGVDHVREQIRDGFDDWGHLVYAEIDGRIVGTVRLNIGGLAEFPNELARVFRLPHFEQFNPGARNFFLGTKLMVDPEYRKTLVSFRLMLRGYEVMRENRVQFSFSGCNPYLIPMYEQLGYRTMGTGFQDPGYGLVVPIVLLPEDVGHLAAVRSPFLRLARKKENSLAAKTWFSDNFSADRYQVSATTSEQDRWNYVARLTGSPLAKIPLLSGLSDQEAKKFLRISTPFGCGEGQQFIRRGDVCNELNLLLKGAMVCKTLAGRTEHIRPGDIIGDIGLLEQKHHQIDAYAVSDCELLAISRTPFEKLRRTLPGLASKLGLEQSGEEVEDNEKQYRTALG